MSQLRWVAAYHVSPPDMSISYCIRITAVGRRCEFPKQVTSADMAVKKSHLEACPYKHSRPLADPNKEDELRY